MPAGRARRATSSSLAKLRRIGIECIAGANPWRDITAAIAVSRENAVVVVAEAGRVLIGARSQVQEKSASFSAPSLPPMIVIDDDDKDSDAAEVGPGVGVRHHG